jgi:hypothetical protein
VIDRNYKGAGIKSIEGIEIMESSEYRKNEENQTT